MNELMAKHTGRPLEQIERDVDRDRFMSAEEAKAYGIIDNVVVSREDQEARSADGDRVTILPGRL
jgi:ATP-dependent Clp protease, protease subunit